MFNTVLKEPEPGTGGLVFNTVLKEPVVQEAWCSILC